MLNKQMISFCFHVKTTDADDKQQKNKLGK